MLTKDKITEIFCIADDFCKNFAIEMANQPRLLSADGKHRRNRSCEMSESEIITILILYHLSSSDNFKAFYLHYIGVHLKQEFPKALSYSRFIQIEHRVFLPMMFFLNTVCFGNCTGITFIDSTKIGICHNKRIYRNKVFQDFAKRGKNTMGWFFGFKLHLICNDKGELLSFCLTTGNTDDRDSKTLQFLTKKLFGKLFGDKGYISALAAYCFFDKKPVIRFDMEQPTGQIALFE